MTPDTTGKLLEHLDAMRALLTAAPAPSAPVARSPERLSENFTLAEMIHSNTAVARGLDNTPPPKVLDQLYLTADRMERVRAILGNKPIRVTSGYRGPEVNRAVGGSRNSAHMTGHAVDFTCPEFGTVAEVARALANAGTALGPFDQIIEEFGSWVHIGFGPGDRRQLLTARKVGGKTVYKPGIA